MLFNATHAEELRVAIVEGQKLIDLDIESAVRSERKGNIYKAVITKVEPSLEACFVNYGADRHGFLPLKEIYRGYFQNYDSSTALQDIRINNVIKEGQEVIVQVDKDERSNKGAALTTFISLAGRFLVLMPNNPKGGGISRRIVGEERNQLRASLDKLQLDNKHSLIARTAGIGRSVEELQWDLTFLTRLWETIEKASTVDKAPYLIYQESNLVVRSIRDHLGSDINEVIIDNKEIFDRATRFVKQVMPHNINKIKFYDDPNPLFTRYQVETQIDAAFSREVSLPSGGSIVIDHTEALVSIDVNSARATKGGDIEETAFQTNLQAVEEVARQLRIRDMGGLVVIDLIDMNDSNHQREVENKLKEALKSDRARVQVGQISRFGLLEMSRQRLRASISDSNYKTCPRCDGAGTIRNVVSASLALLRVIEEEAQKENTEAIQVAVPIDMATYMFNEKRFELHQLEARLASRIIIIPTDDIDSPKFTVRRLRSDELEKISGIASFHQKNDLIEIKNPGDVLPDSLVADKPERPKIEVDDVVHDSPPPKTKKAVKTKTNQKVSLLQRLTAWLFPDNHKQNKTRAKKHSSNTKKTQHGDKRGTKKNNPRQRNTEAANNNETHKSHANKANPNRARKSSKPDNTRSNQPKPTHQKVRQQNKPQKPKGQQQTTPNTKPSADRNTISPNQNQNPNQIEQNPSINQRSPANSAPAETAQNQQANTQPQGSTRETVTQREKGKLSRSITPAQQPENKTPTSSSDNQPTSQNTPQQDQPNQGTDNATNDGAKKHSGQYRGRGYRRNPRNRNAGAKRNTTTNQSNELHDNNKYPSDTNRDDFAPNKTFGKLPDDIGNKD